MRFHSILAVPTVLLSSAIAQTFPLWASTLSPCALACANTDASIAGCNVVDLTCLCNSSVFEPDFIACTAGCPAASTTTPDAVFEQACKNNDWTWGFSPCIRKAAAAAALVVDCNLQDIICICGHYDMFKQVYLDYITDHCPAQFVDAQNALTSSIFCPVIDPPGR